jgi:hypothetical protein
MLTCPMCKRRLGADTLVATKTATKPPTISYACKNCKTDVTLLVDYVENLRDGLKRAEELTRRGELGEAVWEYLAVLEVDPDNQTARRQVGQVATAVRQFDEEAPGRRWLRKLQKRNRFRRWLASWTSGEGDGTAWASGLFWFVMVLAALFIGYALGSQYGKGGPDTPPSKEAGK